MSIELGNARLLQLADILETADEQHTQRGEPTYSQLDYVHVCGTPACALGHWAVANPNDWEVSGRLVRSRADGGRISRADGGRISQCGRDFYIDRYEFDELFGCEGCDGAKTAKDAAAYIRAFVARRQS